MNKGVSVGASVIGLFVLLALFLPQLSGGGGGGSGGAGEDAGQSEQLVFATPEESAVQQWLDSASTEQKIGQLIIGITSGQTAEAGINVSLESDIDTYRLAGVLIKPAQYAPDGSLPGYEAIAGAYFDDYRAQAQWPIVTGLEHDFFDHDEIPERSGLLKSVGYDFNILDILDSGPKSVSDMTHHMMEAGLIPVLGRYTNQDESLLAGLDIAGDCAAILIRNDYTGERADGNLSDVVESVESNGFQPMDGLSDESETQNIRIPVCFSREFASNLRNLAGQNRVLIADEIAWDSFYYYQADIPVSVRIINAGYDMIITRDFDMIYHELLDAVESRSLNMKTLDTACRRVLLWKYYNNMMPGVESEH